MARSNRPTTCSSAVARRLGDYSVNRGLSHGALARIASSDGENGRSPEARISVAVACELLEALVDGLEHELAHVEALREGRTVERPSYDFTTHDRAKGGTIVKPAKVIVVEGILVLSDERLRSSFEVKLFVDTDSDIRLMRRIRRDLEQRGRSFAQVRKQYYETVRPMHLAFVEPSKRFADIIIPEGGQNRVALDFLLGFIRSRG